VSHGGSADRAAGRLCDAALVATAAAFAVPVGELVAASRRSYYAAFARQSAMYLAHVSFGLSFSEIGRAFGRDRTTAAHACRLIEDRRDDPAVDAVLGQLESACAALRRRMNPAVQP
jgi:chromosomal replication initiation ATPase DnaA